MKYLPGKSLISYFSLNKKGFTLVELLIAIAIIAILATVAVAVFGNFQVKARDSRRKADVDAIAGAMEAKYGTSGYLALATTMFASGAIPTDPSTGSSTCAGTLPCKYCVRTGAGTCAVTDTTVAAGAPAAGTSYNVCVNLEETGASPNYYCRANQQ